MEMEPSLHPLPWHLVSAIPLIIQHHWVHMKLGIRWRIEVEKDLMMYIMKLGGGFKYVLFSSLPGEMIQFDGRIFFKWKSAIDKAEIESRCVVASFGKLLFKTRTTGHRVTCQDQISCHITS